MTFCAPCDQGSPGTANFCPGCGAPFVVDPWGRRRRWIWLSLAVTWSAVTLLACLRYHIAQPAGELSVTINGATYTGDPPTLTLYQSDPVSFTTIVIALAASLVVATVDLTLRARQRSDRLGGAAAAAGGLVAAFSLFGLVYGLASLGIVGGLLICSAWPIPRRTRSPVMDVDYPSR